MNKKILISGGAGFIGSNIAVKLLQMGFEVTILDSLSPQIHGKDPYNDSFTFKTILSSDAHFIKGSVTNRDDWKTALNGQDMVIHLAAETGTGQSMYQIEKYNEVNVIGTAILLDILANEPHNIQKIIVASSRAIYGEGKYKCALHGHVYPEARVEADLAKKDFECKCPICSGSVTLMPTDEQSLYKPTSIYGLSKQTQEQMVLIVGKALNIPSIAFRYQNVYGPGQSLSNPYTGILSIFSTQLKNNNPINIFEDGKESRDFVFIDDVVNGTIAGLLSNEADYKTINIGSGEATDVFTVAKQLKKQYNSDADIKITGNYRVGDIRHNYADLTLAKKHLNFVPQYSFTEGLSLFCQWVNLQEIQNDKSQNTFAEMKSKGLFK
ncbi:MAG: NAD-dependent epimerase/dehydratase family protein [Dysgonamonadaceae bacterium]|jgi:dTDP-L-rhamnose 4-epimerase|nr:NAD-dependent epimerase/dehydratase family protein [Dysgonamonadaceae bacterium]MDD3356175.1 NAD-dependent epimerase/dehydratase family protein [Dysgonamonadaceae bacterium]MDD3728050.1 NAD-dependent epimerase/dehydratase family protein [Dysgonamonadaceae bacterium]MDD4245972.1 NAD-dependent epimerase/dehydratase family protein [Dysgonamonadaceae bacterium]